jgi:hypothetical protein
MAHTNIVCAFYSRAKRPPKKLPGLLIDGEDNSLSM